MLGFVFSLAIVLMSIQVQRFLNKTITESTEKACVHRLGWLSMLRMSGTSLKGHFKIILEAQFFSGVWDKSLTLSAPWGESIALQRGHKEGELHFGEAALLLLVILVFMFLFAVFLRRLLTGSMPFGQHVTTISEQLSQPSLSLRWELNRVWSGLCKHSMGKHFPTSARGRCSNSSMWVLGMGRRSGRKGHPA